MDNKNLINCRCYDENQSDRGEPGGLHMNDDGTATLYPVGIAKYEKVLSSNKIVLSFFKELKETHQDREYFNFSHGMIDQIIEDLGSGHETR